MTARPDDDDANDNFLVSLTAESPTTTTTTTTRTAPHRVGGKAASLAKLFAIEGLTAGATKPGRSVVPQAYALTVDFFQAWIAQIQHTPDFQALVAVMATTTTTTDGRPATAAAAAGIRQEATQLCTSLQQRSRTLDLAPAQRRVIQELVQAMAASTWSPPKLAAVRSRYVCVCLSGVVVFPVRSTVRIITRCTIKLCAGIVYQYIHSLFNFVFSTFFIFQVHRKKMVPVPVLPVPLRPN